MLKNSRKMLMYSSLIFLAGCANYSASSLATLPLEMANQSDENTNVLVSWKVFDEKDSKTYLGRDLLSEGYIPVQMTIRNNSTDPMYLNSSNFSIPLPSLGEVSDKVHTSTAARVVGWGAPGLLIWPLLIPAVYDGIKSKEANASLDADYLAKTVKEHLIQPHTSFNGVVFVPKEQVGQPLDMFLVNQRTYKKLSYSLMEQVSR